MLKNKSHLNEKIEIEKERNQRTSKTGENNGTNINTNNNIDDIRAIFNGIFNLDNK